MRGLPSLIAAAFAALAPAAAHAQPEIAEQARSTPEQTVTGFMNAFNAKDAGSMIGYVAEGAIVAMVRERDGDDRFRVRPLAELMLSVTTLDIEIEEPLWNLQTRQFGNVAQVSADFDFLVEGARSHCGTNLFTLMRVDGDWKVASITYSHETEGCEGPPAP